MPAVRGSRLKNGSPTVVSDPAAPLTAEAHPAEQFAHRASGETDRVSGESRRERHRREIFERLVDAARQLMFDRTWPTSERVRSSTSFLRRSSSFPKSYVSEYSCSANRSIE